MYLQKTLLTAAIVAIATAGVTHATTWIDDFTKELNRFRDLLTRDSDELEERLALVRRLHQEWAQRYEKRS